MKDIVIAIKSNLLLYLRMVTPQQVLINADLIC